MKILVNGNFITMNNKPIEALVFDDKIYYAGEMKEALKFDGEIVDLKGKTVIPGLIDITNEFINLMERKSFVNLTNCNNLMELRFAIESKFGINPIIVGYGYDKCELIGGKEISKDDIDYDIPIILTKVNNDKAVVNQAFMKKYKIKDSILFKEDLYKIISSIPEMKEILFDNIPYALTFYYEKGFLTQTIKVTNSIDKELFEDINYSNMIMIGQNDDFNLKSRLITIDTYSNNYLLYSSYELRELLKYCSNDGVKVYLLAHSQQAIDLIRESLLDFEYDLERCTLLSAVFLNHDDIIFFARKGFHFSVLLSKEFEMRKNTDYKFFDYFIKLERYDIEYSIFDLRAIDEFNIFEELRLLFKEKHFYESIWKKRLYSLFKAMTVNKAYSLFVEDKMGQIADGYAANFVILNDDPFENLDGINVLTVYKNGNIVYTVDKK